MSRLPAGILSALMLFLATGCDSTPRDARRTTTMRSDEELAKRADRLFVESTFDDQASRGVRRQRMIFDHQFEAWSTTLTPIGRRDLATLARDLRRDGGRLSIQRGSASAELYAGRVMAVREALLDLGVDPDRLVIEDGSPGGRGTTSRDAILIRTEIRLEGISIPDGEILGSGGGS